MRNGVPIAIAEPIIAAVRKREVLYNTLCDSFWNKSLTDQAWKEVADEIGRDSK